MELFSLRAIFSEILALVAVSYNTVGIENLEGDWAMKDVVITRLSIPS